MDESRFSISPESLYARLGVAAAPRAAGLETAYLEGGIAAWAEQKLPRRKKIGWVIRERPKVDRIDCFVTRFDRSEIHPLP